MNKNNFKHCVDGNPYSAPEILIMEIKAEGVICYSSSADSIIKADELEDYEQIF